MKDGLPGTPGSPQISEKSRITGCGFFRARKPASRTAEDAQKPLFSPALSAYRLDREHPEMRILTMRFLAALVALTVLLSACETVKGVGRDIENAGEAMDEALD